MEHKKLEQVTQMNIYDKLEDLELPYDQEKG